MLHQTITLDGPVTVDRLHCRDFDAVTVTSGGITIDIPPHMAREVARAITEAGALASTV